MKTLSIVCSVAVSLCAFGGEIADFHFKNAQNKFGDSRKSRSHAEVQSTNHGITEIGIERSGCLGTCPIYTFTVKSDGTYRYRGDGHVERKGGFAGKVSVWKFHELARFIKDSGYMELEDSYTRKVTDSPTAYTMVAMNGKRKTVRNYADAGPTKLWAIEQLIDELTTKAEWRNQKEPSGAKQQVKPR